ncbi:MAG: hypothetical protein WDA21_04790 [Bacilli bacterium]
MKIVALSSVSVIVEDMKKRFAKKGRVEQRLRNMVVTGSLLLFVTCGLFAQYSVGIEVTPVLSTGIVGGYENGHFRGELALHFFPLSLITSGGDSYEPIVVGKTVVAGRFASWGNHALYAGAGMLVYIDFFDRPFGVIGVGPALQYAWKFPSRQIELSFDFAFPLLFKDNYEDDPADDFLTVGSFVAFMLMVMAPSIGISWTF